MKIGIVTIVDYVNYGNRLQNLALTRLLEMEGFEVVNGIEVYVKSDWVKRSHNRFKRMVKRLVPLCIVKDILYTIPKPENELLGRRRKRFKDFCKSYTNIIEPIIANDYISAWKFLTKHYGIDYYVTGSDQVWNPYYEGKAYEFLCFAPRSKRLSFAASIGAEEIPDGMKEYYKKHLEGMKYISVRETKAAILIKELVGKEVDVTFDPTLLLPIDEWDKVIKKPNAQLSDEYICTYFLGEKPAAVQKFIREKELPSVELNSISEEELFVTDPGEFLYYIKNATYVLTDSFHGVAFSILFNKEFYVFDRKQINVSNMFSRIESILNILNLNNRFQDRENICEQKRIDTWKEINELLSFERVKSMCKLKNEMNG